MFRRWQRRRPKVSQGLRSHSTPVVLCTVKRWTLSSFSRWPPIIASHSQRLFWRVNAAHYWQATAKKQKRGETREIEAWRMSNWLKGVPSSCKIANRCAINAPRFFLDPFPDRISVARSCPAMVLFFFSYIFRLFLADFYVSRVMSSAWDTIPRSGSSRISILLPELFAPHRSVLCVCLRLPNLYTNRREAIWCAVRDRKATKRDRRPRRRR